MEKRLTRGENKNCVLPFPTEDSLGLPGGFNNTKRYKMKSLLLRFVLLLVILLAVPSPGQAQQKSDSLDPYAHETDEQRDARMAWFREAKFGLFIHWGVYAVPAGTYKGKQISGMPPPSASSPKVLLLATVLVLSVMSPDDV